MEECLACNLNKSNTAILLFFFFFLHVFLNCTNGTKSLNASQIFIALGLCFSWQMSQIQDICKFFQSFEKTLFEWKNRFQFNFNLVPKVFFWVALAEWKRDIWLGNLAGFT